LWTVSTTFLNPNRPRIPLGSFRRYPFCDEKQQYPDS